MGCHCSDVSTTQSPLSPKKIFISGCLYHLNKTKSVYKDAFNKDKFVYKDAFYEDKSAYKDA